MANFTAGQWFFFPLFFQSRDNLVTSSTLPAGLKEVCVFENKVAKKLEGEKIDLDRRG